MQCESASVFKPTQKETPANIVRVGKAMPKMRKKYLLACTDYLVWTLSLAHLFTPVCLGSGRLNSPGL